MKKGFSIVELIISIALIAGVTSLTVVLFVTNRKNNDKTAFSTEEVTILDAAKLYISSEYDLEGSKYIEQLNLGAQGIQISLNKLVSEGLISDSVISNLYQELKKDDSNITLEEVKKYYVLVLNGSLNSNYLEDPCNGLLTYYLSWKNDFDDSEKTLYLCGTLPKSDTTNVKVKITDNTGYFDYYSEYNDNFYPTVKDEEDNEILPDDDGKFSIDYGKKYYIELNDISYFDIEQFNKDKNYVYLKLSNLEDVENGKIPILYFDLESYEYFLPNNNCYNQLSSKISSNVKETINFNNRPDGFNEIYKDYDDWGVTSFYRGNNVNNYVRFAGYLWRIIRENGDGSIRMILDGDIGSTKWNDTNEKNKSNAFIYGVDSFQPLIGTGVVGKKQICSNEKCSNSYCYSNEFKYNKETNEYSLSGDISCNSYWGAIRSGYYTLYSDKKYATSKKLYEITFSTTHVHYGSFQMHKLYETDSTDNEFYVSDFNGKYCYGSDYEIKNGQYKLSGTINCKKLSYSNISDYGNYYTLKKEDKNSTSLKMYKIVKQDKKYYVRNYNKIIPVGITSSSNTYQKLKEFYNKLLNYRSFLETSTFCNDIHQIESTTSSSKVYSSYNRLANESISKNPTFKCEGAFDYGGVYNLKVGLVTADEMAFAGAVYENSNRNYYLAYKKPYWTMTPYDSDSMFSSNIYSNHSYDTSERYWYDESTGVSYPVDDSTDCSSVECYSYTYNNKYVINFDFFKNTNLTTITTLNNKIYDGDSDMSLRPVINLRSDVLIESGTGTYGDPYVIDTESSDYFYCLFGDRSRR